jgi:hypothetical protein
MPLTVIPVPDTTIADVLVRLVPVRDTATVWPRTLDAGVIEVSVGAAAGGISMAPISIAFAPRGVL